MIYNGKLSGTSTYQDLMEFAFGKPGLIAISIFQFVFAFGGMAAYCVIIGKLCMREDEDNKTLFY